MGTGHSLYENNSTGFSPYGSCNINTQQGCELDTHCTLFQQCVPLAAKALEEQQYMIETYGPHMDMTSKQYKDRKTQIEVWLNSDYARELFEKNAQEIADALNVPFEMLPE